MFWAKNMFCKKQNKNHEASDKGQKGSPSEIPGIHTPGIRWDSIQHPLQRQWGSSLLKVLQGGRMLDLSMTKEQELKHGTQRVWETWHLEKGELRLPVSSFLEPSKGEGAINSFLQTGKQPRHEGGHHTQWVSLPVPWPQANHPISLISGPPLPNAVVCIKEAISVFLLKTLYFCFLGGPALLERELLIKTGSTYHTRVSHTINWHSSFLLVKLNH